MTRTDLTFTERFELRRIVCNPRTASAVADYPNRSAVDSLVAKGLAKWHTTGKDFGARCLIRPTGAGRKVNDS